MKHPVYLIRSICSITLVCLTINGCKTSIGEQPDRVLLTPETVARLMRENEKPAKQQISRHINLLALSIRTNSLATNKAYIRYLDASADKKRARHVLRGLRTMRAGLTVGLKYEVACMKGKQPSKRYGWVDDHLHIKFCNVFEDKVEGKIGWHFHEMSHFQPPYGLGTVDHAYKRRDCNQLAKSNPDIAVGTAACITHFLNSPLD